MDAQSAKEGLMSKESQPAKEILYNDEFFDDPSEGATLRTKNDPNKPYQRSVITSRGRNWGFSAIVTLSRCVHGFLQPDKKKPATLIFIRYELRNTNLDNKIKAAYTELEFSNETTTSLRDEPHIRAFAPFEEAGKADVTTNKAHENTGKKLESFEVNAPGGGVKVGGQLGKVRDEDINQHYFQVLQASTELSKDFGPGPNTVWWNMQASKYPGAGSEGVPPTLTVGMLVQRKDKDAKFKAKFKLSLQGGLMSDAKATFWGIIRRDDPILFDPNLPSIGGEGIDKDNLEQYTSEKLKELGAGFQNLVVHDK